MAEDRYKYFRIEAKELLDDLYKGVLELEKGTATVRTAGLLRYAHTLKGAARVVKQPEIADHAHAIEEVLDPIRDSTERVPPDRIEVVLGLLDAIGGLITELPRPDGTLAMPDGRRETAAPARAELARTIRADVAEMDVLLDGVAEAHAQVSSLRGGIRGIERARGLADVIVSQLETSRSQEVGRADAEERSRRARVAATELRSTVTSLEQELGNDVEQIDRELRQLRDSVEHMRLVPAGALFPDLERAARDVAQAQSKRVVFEGRGGEVRLEAHVLGVAQAALQQIVRNAVAHGIETRDERQASGKSPQGHVTLDVATRGRRAVFSCHDDGRGIDLEALRSAAHGKGLLFEDTGTGTPEELMRVLLRGGLSTSGHVTELSGRGIGLDVVRDAATRLGGEVTVTTEATEGTTVTLEVPLSLVSFEALAVEAAGITAFVPLDAVSQTLRVRSADIHLSESGESLTYNGAVIPFLSLATILAEPVSAPQPGVAWSVVVVEGRGSAAAVGVHRLFGTSSIVVRPLPPFLVISAVISGVWLDADGYPKLVLDPDELVAEALRERRSDPVSAGGPDSPVLVIDDSLTTRMLEQSILESAGYSVDVASSGEEALAMAQSKQYLLFLVDVEMPGMDGFTFIEHTRVHPQLREIPAVLVTSRSSHEDRQRGLDAGASAYITKGEFDQGGLLDRIRALTAT